jgi:hypothetical protein
VFRAHEKKKKKKESPISGGPTWWRPNAWPEDRGWKNRPPRISRWCVYPNPSASGEKRASACGRNVVSPLHKADGRPASRTWRASCGHVDDAEIYALVDGARTFLHRNPLVLHQLRYLFRVHAEERKTGFWIVLQDFLAKKTSTGAGRTADFIRRPRNGMGKPPAGTGLNGSMDDDSGRCPGPTNCSKIPPEAGGWT